MNMNLQNLNNKKIALGLGVENYALLNYCLKHKVKAVTFNSSTA